MKIGDKVEYNVEFLANIGANHTEIAHDRGIIVDASVLGSGKLCKILWDNGDETYVHSNNLAIVGPNIKFCKC